MRFFEATEIPDRPTDEEMRLDEIRERRRHAPRCGRCGAFARSAAGISPYRWDGEYDPQVDCGRCGRQPMGGPNG